MRKFLPVLNGHRREIMAKSWRAKSYRRSKDCPGNPGKNNP
jgi:hypothetical protein